MNERICKECGFFKLDIFIDCLGHCTISGNTHNQEDICEAEKGRADNERKAD